MYTFNRQEFAWLQGFLNDLYQDYQVRSGPSGAIVEAVRSKFLVFGDVDLADDQRRFLLYNVNDVYQSTHGVSFKPQISLQVSFVGDEDTHGELRQVVSQIQQLTGTSGNAQLTPQYLPTWNVMKNIMTKLGQVAPPPFKEDRRATVDRTAQDLGPLSIIDPDDRMQ